MKQLLEISAAHSYHSLAQQGFNIQDLRRVVLNLKEVGMCDKGIKNPKQESERTANARPFLLLTFNNRAGMESIILSANWSLMARYCSVPNAS